MEPRVLINQNGSLKQGRRSISAEMTPAMKAELVATPIRAPSVELDGEEVAAANDESSLDSAFSTPTGVQRAAANVPLPATPTGFVHYDPAAASPTTPYYMAQGAKLVQQTCPPKQSRQGLFPVSGKVGDQEDEGVRLRLEAARRSMGWKPRVGSPLGR